MLKRSMLLAALLLSVGVNAKTPVSSGAYYAGGAVGTIVGYGIGHAIQERYGEIGWVFTVGEVGGLALVGGGWGWLIASLPTGVKWKDAKRAQINKGAIALTVVGAVITSGFRIWEIVDVWVGATPVDGGGETKAMNYLNKDEGRFAGATELGVAAINVPLFSFNF